MSDIEQRLREAHTNSQQYANGSHILLEAADELARLQSEVERLQAASIKTDNSQTLVNALAEIERLRGRVIELGIRCAHLDELVIKLQAINKADELRKQAEAVEAARDEICEFRGELWNAAQPDELTDYAQRLRNQADELENNNAQEQ